MLCPLPMRKPALRSLQFALVLVVAALCAGCGAEPAASESPGAAPTYHGEVKAIVDAKCVGCHVAGGIAPFSLETYADLVAYGGAAVAAVEAGTMPPWPAEEGCTDYRNDRSLSAAQRQALVDWHARGELEGTPEDGAPLADGASPGLSRVDAELPLPEPYTPAGQPDDYRCFLVDFPEGAARYVTGFGVRPGVDALVHHVIAFLAPEEQLATFAGLDAAEPGPGWTCFGGPGGDQVAAAKAGWIGGWAPGSLGSDFPSGTGILVPEGAKLVLQVHYNTLSAPPEPDRTSVVLRLDEAVERRAIMMPWADIDWVVGHAMEIPPHGKDVVHSWSFDPTAVLGFLSDGAFTPNQPITLHSASLHMHTFGKRARTVIERSDGSEACLLSIDRWNFHWQGAYGFEEPKVLSPGDFLNLECTWDNPTNDPLNWGEGTGDEMCLGVYYVTQ